MQEAIEYVQQKPLKNNYQYAYFIDNIKSIFYQIVSKLVVYYIIYIIHINSEKISIYSCLYARMYVKIKY